MLLKILLTLYDVSFTECSSSWSMCYGSTETPLVTERTLLLIFLHPPWENSFLFTFPLVIKPVDSFS